MMLIESYRHVYVGTALYGWTQGPWLSMCSSHSMPRLVHASLRCPVTFQKNPLHSLSPSPRHCWAARTRLLPTAVYFMCAERSVCGRAVYSVVQVIWRRRLIRGPRARGYFNYFRRGVGRWGELTVRARKRCSAELEDSVQVTEKCEAGSRKGLGRVLSCVCKSAKDYM